MLCFVVAKSLVLVVIFIAIIHLEGLRYSSSTKVLLEISEGIAVWRLIDSSLLHPFDKAPATTNFLDDTLFIKHGISRDTFYTEFYGENIPDARAIAGNLRHKFFFKMLHKRLVYIGSLVQTVKSIRV